MSPNLSVLVANADSAKQNLAIRVSANETSAKLAEAANQRHREDYAAMQAAASDLSTARAAIDAALDADYGQALEPIEESSQSDDLSPPPSEAAVDVAIEELTADTGSGE